jgi:hypothetical protein
MSRGLGKLQQFILSELQMSAKPVSAAELRRSYLFEIWDPDTGPRDFEIWDTAARRRSVRMSVDRALRQLTAAGHIKRDESGEWYPTKDWTARDDAAREHSETAYHEAGHAVIGLALRLPIAFATIKPRGHSLGHVSRAPVHHGVGTVYARGSYDVVHLPEVDAFGNATAQSSRDYHADIVMTIAGGMAQAEHMKDGSAWREHASPGDMRSIGYGRRKLGNAARSIEDYATECSALVKQHWSKIEAVAAKLLKEETLSGSDLYDVCWRDARNVVRRQHLKRRR